MKVTVAWVTFAVSFSFSLLGSLSGPWCAIANASDQVGTLTLVDGTVKLFSNPAKGIQGPPPHALFEGNTYSVHDAKVGDHVELGNVLRTAPGAHARIVFENGDQYMIGSGTAYRVQWDKDSKDSPVQLGLMYGRFRGVVEKGGPRSHLTIRTKSATMGVRGTDFFIADGGEGGGTEISTLRGLVAVTPLAAPGADASATPPKTIEVTKGLSAAIPPPSPSVIAAPSVALRKTTKEEFTVIQKISVTPPPTPSSEPMVQELETKAAQTLLKDIKTGDPELYEKMKAQPQASVGELDKAAVESLKQDAPKGSAKHKPGKGELEDLEGGAYEKYFHNVE